MRAAQPSITASSNEKKTPTSSKKRKLENSASAPSVASTPGELDGSKSRTPRDPGMPKRPHNAFFYFSQERRPSMQKEFPHLTKKEIAALLSQKWTDLPSHEKEIYIKLQNERKRQYQAIMARYNESRSLQGNVGT